MANSKVNIEKFRKAMQDNIKELGSPENMRVFGEYARDRIVKRTRLGKGVSERGGDPESLERLADRTKDARKRLKDKGKLSPLSSPGKSNLTATGQMLDSIRVKVQAGVALIAPEGNRRKIGNENNVPSNAEVAGYVSEVRPFLNLSKPELKGLSDLLRSVLEKIVKRS